jgi:SP family arabinose:H+ symporter-like MFS transporter
MNRRIVLWSATSALAGFLFGFDTVVISGAEQAIQTLWGLGPAVHGFAMGSALYGTILGALCGGWPTDRLGRTATLRCIGILYVVSAIGSAFAWDVGSLIVARFIGGLGIGIATVAAPLYIAEIAPPAARGWLTALFQFNIVFGILAAFASNFFLGSVGEHAWRWMLGVEAIPALFYTALCFTLPESPRWLLVYRNNRDGAVRTLQLLRPEFTQTEIDATVEEIVAASREAPATERFWTRRLQRPILLAILIAVFNQLSGINAVLYFAPRIFEMTGLGPRAALLQSVGIGATNLVFTLVGLWLIDRLGRRSLLVIGSLGYISSLGLTAWAFFAGQFTLVPAAIFAFIAAHAVGQGAVIWVFIAEIFPTAHRARGQALGSFTHWLFAALLTTLFPSLVTAFAPGWIFLFFCGMMMLQLMWVVLWVPETRGVPLETIERHLAGLANTRQSRAE